MHFQASIPNWPDALLRMPDGAVLKAFDAGLLKDGKQKWAAAGRDPAKLITVLRHANIQTSPRDATWEEAKTHWREMFWRFVDGTYLREFVGFVDLVSEANEYWTLTTWTDPDGGAGVKRSLRAAQAVWNDEFRGRTVTNPHDGGQGDIPAHCRIALGAVSVSQDWPRDLLAEVIAGDNVADIHCYSKYNAGVRQSDDWVNHSGRFHTLEQKYGLKPRWLFGESGPYNSTEDGWRAASCLGANVEALVAAMQDWWADLATTPAYQEGRIVGPGCWFTSGHVGWEQYQLEVPELIRLADLANALWKPGQGDEPVDTKQIIEWADQIIANAEKIKAEVSRRPVLYQATVPATRRVRDLNGSALSPDMLLAAGTVVEVYSDPPREIGGWQERVEISDSGLNIWAEGLVKV